MQLETPNDVDLARATLLATEGATCVAVRNGETMVHPRARREAPPPMDFRGPKLRGMVCRRQGCEQSAGSFVRTAQARCGLRDCHERSRTRYPAGKRDSLRLRGPGSLHRESRRRRAVSHGRLRHQHLRSPRSRTSHSRMRPSNGSLAQVVSRCSCHAYAEAP